MRRANRIIPLLLLCFGTTYSIATEPTPDFSRGRAMLDAYLRDQVRQISDACLSDVKSRADWEAKRPELRRQFLEMIGLWPLPARTALNPVITGRIEGERFNIEKLHFQSIPGLYVTANLYIPKLTTFPAPTILYVCGHSPTVVDKVPHGNKVSYQHHPAWFAEHGYACLILDTLELGEVPGVHHGTYRFNQWWWQAAGYTPAGIECWNAMRALDYLETRPEVDRKRIGVTGRSGGGATSWWLAAADDRPQCIVPVAGIADLKAHVIEPCLPHYPRGVINGHCDCMYFVNTYRWDFAMAAALCAPRPLMLGNSDQDYIFPVSGYRRLADKVAKIYGLYGAAEKFVVLETSGPHKDTPELRLGAYRWMNQWLSQPTREMSEQARPKILPQDLKVLSSAPSGAINATVQETLVKPAQPLLPAVPEVAKEWWQGKRQELMLALQEKVFRGWPARPPALDLKLAADIQHGGVRLRAYDFVSEPGIELRLWLLTSAKVARPSVLVLEALDEPGWNEWRAGLGPEFEKAIQSPRMPLIDEAKFAQNRRAMDFHKWAFAVVVPRGVGPTRWAEAGSAAEIHDRRRFALLGQTLAGQQVWDVRRSIMLLRELPDLAGVPCWIQGRGEMAGVSLYAFLFEPKLERIDLWHPPASHREGPIFLNILRFLDMPQGVALAFPRQVRLNVEDSLESQKWEWPNRLQKSLGSEYLKIRETGDSHQSRFIQ